MIILTSLLVDGNFIWRAGNPNGRKIKQVKPEDLVGPLKTSSIIQRHSLNPIFTSENVPYPSVIAYIAGVVKYQQVKRHIV